MDLSKCLRPSGADAEMDIIVTPSSNIPGVQDVDPWRHRLVVKVHAPPEGGKANEEVEELLSTVIDTKVQVIRGHTQRMKVVLLHSSPDKVKAALEGRR